MDPADIRQQILQPLLQTAKSLTLQARDALFASMDTSQKIMAVNKSPHCVMVITFKLAIASAARMI